ncbi:3-hydroxyacyl-CoA dehydrogenase NAD-binding domain-containing protein [Ensifer soli]|uniref:3-hydroxyacyl-CoA dehydrogenase NAD-binding domain-containing protein n=1 Tax=Ciceribacter sp. sgz301302 TaxID=3342379 RepID=UPI0035B9B06D
MAIDRDYLRRQGAVGIVGLGTIGQRWAAAFRHAGLDVRAYDPDPSRAAAFDAAFPALLADVEALHGPAPALGAFVFSGDLGAALAGVTFVQENGPERLDLKQALLAEIERHVDDDVVIASSSSALIVSEMQRACARPGRIVLGHPFNPAHLMPLVEIVGGAATAPETVATARAFYEAIGRKPVVLNREVTGHLALRLMGAMWREAIALVRDGVASVEDIDRAFVYGPGPKWTLQGSFISNHLNADGIDAFLVKYGPTYQAIWDDLGDAMLDRETIATVSSSLRDTLGARSDDDLRAERDRGLVKILKAVSEDGAL